MRGFRYLLLAVSLAGALASVAAVADIGARGTSFEIALLLGIALTCTINFVVLLQYGTPSKTRIGRMFRLWLDAKEQDLKTRANAP